MQVNKATVDTVKEKKINRTIIKAEIKLGLRKKSFHDKKSVVLIFMNFLVNDWSMIF